MKKSFDRQEGLDKMVEMVESINVCMFLTRLDDTNHVRPMATAKAEPNGTLWFFSNTGSLKMNDLKKSSDVQLLYSHPGKNSYLDILGTATIENSREKVEEYWTPLAKEWFPGGKDDPELCLIKVEVDSAYHWDSSSSKMVAFFRRVAAAVSGDKIAGTEEGALIR